MYSVIIPRMNDVISIYCPPSDTCQLILENKRSEIYTTNWEASKYLKRKPLINLSDHLVSHKLEDFGIEKGEGEICFQWFL